ncbi:MAG: hypothetical protein ACRD0Y_06905 [Terriglobales bacterium]
MDLHRHLRLVGLTFGIEPTSATLGWAAMEPLQVVRGAHALPISGLALHFNEITRFEVAFERDPPGQLDYFEFVRGPDLEVRFFFEGGTVRIGAATCRAELIIGGEDDDSDDGNDLASGGSGLLQ